MNRKKAARRAVFSGLLLAVALLAGQLASGHAILKESSPAANSTVSGPSVPILLKFNVRIDAARSQMKLLHPDNTTTDLVIDKQTSPDTLNTQTSGLTPGAYRVRWQVLAPDGHITRGEVPFTVKGS